MGGDKSGANMERRSHALSKCSGTNNPLKWTTSIERRTQNERIKLSKMEMRQYFIQPAKLWTQDQQIFLGGGERRGAGERLTFIIPMTPTVHPEGR